MTVHDMRDIDRITEIVRNKLGCRKVYVSFKMGDTVDFVAEETDKVLVTVRDIKNERGRLTFTSSVPLIGTGDGRREVRLKNKLT